MTIFSMRYYGELVRLIGLCVSDIMI